MGTFKADPKFAAELDASDPCAKFRDHFAIPYAANGKQEIYFLGNSLGLQPKSVNAYLKNEIDQWAKRGSGARFEGQFPWMNYHEFVAQPLADLVGAKLHEVVAMNGVTVNLQLMLSSFYRPTKNRWKVLVAYRPFPSDSYALTSHLKQRGLDPKEGIIEVMPWEGEVLVRNEEVESYLEESGDSIALILMDGVNYYSGQFLDLKRITELGHAKGCMVGFDLSHAAGNVPLSLHDWDVDFAVWCSYKYLNGGQGAIGGCFVNERHGLNKNTPRLGGWWGQNKKTRLEFGADFDPIPGAEGWMISCPPIFSLATLRASLDIFSEATLPLLREKSIKLTGYLEFLIKHLDHKHFSILTPDEPESRGCQLSLLVKHDGQKLFDELCRAGVACDWRGPDVIRLAPTPLYNTYCEVYQLYELIRNKIS